VKVLFLTISDIQSISHRGIYTDLLREFRDRGDDVCVVCPSQRRLKRATQLVEDEGVTILRVRTGNITQAGTIEKGISTMLIERQYLSAIRRYLGDVMFDLVLYSTPPITLDRVVQRIKRRCGSTSYLLLKDIFPQNAVDLGMMRKGGLVWRYFRAREKQLYAVSDCIGCMSPANVTYLLRHNEDVRPDTVEVCPNSIRPREVKDLKDTRGQIRETYGIPQESLLLVFGGNLGKPQGVDFLLDVLDRIKERTDVFLLIVGSGIEYPRIEAHLNVGSHPYARLVEKLPKEQYDALLTECDVGLILLDRRFTIPNFPSRLTAYMEMGLPIIAATDPSTDIGTILQESGSGFWVAHGDIEGFVAAINRLSADRVLRIDMGRKGRAYLEEHYTVARAYEIIAARVRGRSRESQSRPAGKS
jgi:glycosyltransferase involved in cell wall biosynthesis